MVEGHEVRGPSILVAAVAAAAEIPLCTRNPGDVAGLDDLVTAVEVVSANHPGCVPDSWRYGYGCPA